MYASEFIDGKFEFTEKLSKYQKEELPTLCNFDDVLFNSQGYISCNNITPLRKLMSHITNNNVLIEVGENKGVYDTNWLFPVFLNIPINLKLKIDPRASVLCINYDFYGCEIYSCVAAKFIPYEDADKVWVVE